MNRFRFTFSYSIEQANDDGHYEPFDNSSRCVHHLTRQQMKFLEGLLLNATSAMHTEGMKHPDVTVEDAMRHPALPPLPPCHQPPPLKGKK